MASLSATQPSSRAGKKSSSASKRRLIAFDTETTGLDIWHGCKPFFVSTCDDDGFMRHWEWDVDPYTREPLIPDDERDAVAAYLGADDVDLVAHNAPFDMRALASIGIDLSHKWETLFDTHVASHVLRSDQPHALKPLSVLYSGVPESDEKAMMKCVDTIRRLCDQKYPYGEYTMGGKKTFAESRWHVNHKMQPVSGKGWRIGKAGDPHFPSQDKKFNRGDMWLCRAWAKAHNLPPDHPYWTALYNYAVRDAERTMCLRFVFGAGLDQGVEDGYDCWNIFRQRMKMLRILYTMSGNGVCMNAKLYNEASEEYQNRVELHTSEALRDYRRHTGEELNPAALTSDQQLQTVIFKDLEFKPKKLTKTEAPSTAKEVLEELLPAEHPYHKPPVKDESGRITFLSGKAARTPNANQDFLMNLLRRRRAQKCLDYLDAYQQFGIRESYRIDGKRHNYYRIHPSFNLCGTATTRLSSSDPNQTNVAKKEGYNLRSVFCPAPGRVLFDSDFSNVEMRVFAFSSGEERLIQAFHDGTPFHMIIFRILHPEYAGLSDAEAKKTDAYSFTKNGNFSLIYGAGETKANATYKVPNAFRKIRREFTKIDSFMREKYEEAEQSGYVTILGGYRLRVKGSEPHKAVNYFCQGSASWFMAEAMIDIDAYLNAEHRVPRDQWDYRIPGKPLPKEPPPTRLADDYQLVMQVHDSLVLDAPAKYDPNVIRTFQQLMEAPCLRYGIPCPVETDICVNTWGDGKPFTMPLAL
jgi:DNA polymerase I-like protein with 3'-5' exonuclease and polymerase domains